MCRLFSYGIGIHLLQSGDPENMPKISPINPKDNHISFQVCLSPFPSLYLSIYITCILNLKLIIKWHLMAVWEHGNSREKIEGDEDRVCKGQGRGGWNLRWSAVFPWPRWVDDRNLQLWQPPCYSTSWRCHSIVLTYNLQYPTTEAAYCANQMTTDTAFAFVHLFIIL